MGLTVGSLFSGIGGIDLACEWAGMEVIWQCEIDPFCQKVLKKHWPEVKLYDDIHSINRHNTIRPDVLVGGYPCQGESVAGQRKGQNDERWLWPQMFRIIHEFRPSWVVGENVAGHVTLGLDEVLTNLEEENYSCRTFVLPAYSVGAHDERYRALVVAHTNSKPKSQAHPKVSSIRGKRNARKNIAGGDRGEVSSTYWETHKPPVCGVDDGISDRFYKDRMKALGNAVKPQQIYPIFKAIYELEEGT